LREKIKAKDGTKLLGGQTGERATATAVPSDFLKYVQKELGLQQQPDAIR
jgi:hypothetical protein